MNIVTDNKDLDVIIPISLELDAPTKESIFSEILEQNERYGFTRFALAAPCGGWRSYQYPPKSHFIERATMFAEIKNRLMPYGIRCGWWNTLTIKSGPSDEWIRMTKADGTKTPFASCPLDRNFQKRFAEDMATFAQIAKPAFIITEDDYSIHAASGYYGCFCEYHLAEFAKRTGRAYTREELLEIFGQDTPTSNALLREWKKLAKDSLVALAKAVRTEVDKLSPEISIGYMQSGAADADGDCTEEVSRALAGANHTPFSRLHGTFYCGGDTVRIPEMFHHALYSKQHIGGNFRFYHESDTFPHTRYFSSASQMRIIMSTAYSYGFDGSIFQTQQLLDNPNEEPCYGLMFAKERKRFNALGRVARACQVKGVHIPYDAFWNSVDAYTLSPIWAYCIGRFGLPYTTLPAKVAFLDAIQAKRLEKEELIKYLSSAVFVDGDAAKILCERGFACYLGVTVGEDVASDSFGYDLGAREVIRPSFIPNNKGRNMPIAHMYACGKNGKLLRLSTVDERCEIVSDAYNFQGKHVCPAMTRFENSLGGKVVVLGMTLKNNGSQSLFNYRRKRLFEELLVWCDDSIAFVKDAPDVFCIMNEAVSPNTSGFKGLLTITNLCFDSVESVSVYLPKAWRENAKFYTLQQDGEWQQADVSLTNDGITLNSVLLGHDSVYLLIV